MTPESEKPFLDGLSPEARAAMAAELRRPRAAPPSPTDIDAWKARQREVEAASRPACERALERFKPSLSEAEFAGMPAVVIMPRQAAAARPPLVFLHGGAYCFSSAGASLFASVPLAATLRRTVISLDYPLAPTCTFETTVPATARALDAVLGAFPGASLAGDSAGGGLAVAACNHLLRQATRCVHRLVLISPWTDLGNRGDSRLTQRAHDPLLRFDPALKTCAEAYAGQATDAPEASPVLAKYDASFPPTLLICGTREILLSDSVRLFHRLVDAGCPARLDVYEGLYHSFPVVTPFCPEADRARASIKDFLDP